MKNETKDVADESDVFIHITNHSTAFAARNVKTNYIMTVVFFVILFIQISAFHVFNIEEDDQNKFFNSISNILSILITFCTNKELECSVKISVVLYLSSSFIILSGFLFIFLKYSLIIQPLLSFIFTIWIYILPSIFTLFSNSYLHVLLHYADRFDILTEIILMLHIGLFFLLSFGNILLSSSYHPIVHPFVGKSPLHTILISLYLLLTIHFNSPFIPDGTFTQAVLIILDFAVLIWIFVDPPYLNRINNIFLMSSSLYSFSTEFIFNFIRPSYPIVFVLIVLSVLFSILYFYVVIRLFIKVFGMNVSVQLLYILNEKAKVREILRNLQFTNVDNKNLRIYIQIANKLRVSNLRDMIDIFISEFMKTFNDKIFIYSAIYNNELNDKTIPKRVKTMLSDVEHNIELYTKEFWREAWLSNISDLPSTASKISIQKGILFFLVQNLEKKYSLNNVYIDPDTQKLIDNLKTKSIFQRLKSRISCTDISNFVTALIFLIFHILLIFYVSIEIDKMNYLSEFVDFTSYLYFFDSSNLSSIDITYINESVNFFNSEKYGHYDYYYHRYFLEKNNFTDHIESFLKALESGIDKEILDKYQQLVLSIDSFLVNLSCQYISTSKGFMVRYGLMLLILDGLILLFLLVLVICNMFIYNSRLKNTYKKFLFIPKECFRYLLDENLKMTAMDYAPKYYSFFDNIKSYKASLTHLIFTFISFIVITIIFNCHYLLLMSSINTFESSIITFLNVQRIPIWLGYLKVYSSYDEDVAEIGKVLDGIFDYMTKEHSDIASLFDTNFNKMIGDILLLRKLPSVSRINSSIKHMHSIILDYQPSFDSFKKDCIIITVLFILIHLLLFVYLCYFMYLTSFFRLFENAECEILYRKAINLFPVNDLDVLSQTINKNTLIENTNIFMLIINGDYKVLFATKYVLHGVLKEFVLSKLDRSIRNEIFSLIESFKKTYTDSPVLINGRYSDKTFVVNPVYIFENKMIFDHVVIIEVDGNVNEVAMTRDNLKKMFYTIYPPFLSIDQEFPLFLPQELTTDVIAVVTITGLREWMAKTTLESAQNFRIKISQIFFNHCQDDVNFIRFFETDSSMFAHLDRKNQKTNKWRVVNDGATFLKKVISSIKDEIAALCLHMEVKGLLFKCPEPEQIFMGITQEFPDLGINYIKILNNVLPHCRADSILYFSLKNETQRPIGTSYYKKIYTADGKEVDLLTAV